MLNQLNQLGAYGYILTTIAMTVYGQLVLKWRIVQLGPLPEGFKDKTVFLILLVFDPFIATGYLAAFIAALSWTAALSRFQLNFAYPFMSLSYVLVLLMSNWLLGEPLTWQRTFGVGLIVAGTVIAARA